MWTANRKARLSLSKYIVRHPISVQKILYARSNGTIKYKTKYNAYWEEHMPPKHKHLIRYYGLYSSRTKGRANKDGSLAKFMKSGTTERFETPTAGGRSDGADVSVSIPRSLYPCAEVSPPVVPYVHPMHVVSTRVQ